MPRYSFTIEDGIPVVPEDATEDLADNHVALDRAKMIAKDLARSPAHSHMRVVVRDDSGTVVGSIPLTNSE